MRRPNNISKKPAEVDEKNVEGDLEDRIEHQDFDAEGQGLGWPLSKLKQKKQKNRVKKREHGEFEQNSAED